MPSDFYTQVYAVVRRVPRGKVVTYGQIARHLGAPQGARAVGWAMHQCPADVPWQRVLNARGGISMGAHSLYGSLQRSLLEDEGVVFDPAGHVPLEIYGWDEI
jgi:methylated-DNA-protein-cysteine methyltransferase-like protein